ncbi:hypothetical protein OB236_13920 [Paenibacillus sp. WQ 127069]|uniref:Lipoprotein n=1 Tax=Paenibacillus baimaensis TaxID=2982185 RepID=A0ABT2UEY9_9BACL|nr:hypothetical protein [Paenibacillus sp. WQ 127069]MCU6793215.1 hypothetical protein [Paenibacillus sp. WQ 127069]
MNEERQPEKNEIPYVNRSYYKLFFVILVFVAIIIGCDNSSESKNSSEFKTMKSDYEKLKIANDELNKKVSLQMKELDELKNGPGKMIALAQDQYNARKYTDAKKTIQDLTTKYPSSPEVAKSKELLILIESDQVKQKEEDKQRIALATSKMKAEVDEVENITWHTDTSTKASGSSVHAYVGKPEKGKLQLRMVFRFEGLSWLYVQSYKIKTDDKTFDFAVDYNNVKRTTKSSKIYETWDKAFTRRDLEISQNIISSPKPIVRFTGKDSSSDYEVTDSEKQALKNVIDAFLALGGSLDEIY